MLADRAGKIVLGDQMDMMTDLGPLVSRSQVETVERYVAVGRDEVGEPIVGGSKPDGLPDGLDPDAFYQPTIFADVDNKAKIAQEEIFGPVLSRHPLRHRRRGRGHRQRLDLRSGRRGAERRPRAGQGGGRPDAHRHRVDQRLPPDQPRAALRWLQAVRASGVSSGTFGFEAYRQVKHVHVNPETAGRDNHFHYALLSNGI